MLGSRLTRSEHHNVDWVKFDYVYEMFETTTKKLRLRERERNGSIPIARRGAFES